MPFNGSGTFTRLYSWVADAFAGIPITASRMDAELNGVATGLSNCLTRDGQSPPSADLPMGGRRITGLANGTNPTDAAAFGQIVTPALSVAAFGAAGSAVAITDASPDERGAIQAALDYANANGITRVVFPARHYALRRTPRTYTASADIHASQSGILLRTYKGIELVSLCPDGTDLWRRKTDGTAYDWTDYQTNITGVGEWRGGLLFIEGQTSDPGDPNLGSLVLDGVRLQGGCLGGDHGGYQDITDKGVWQSNDRYCGNLTFRNGAGVFGCLGELVYTSSGTNVAAAKRLLTIDATCTFGESNISCLNLNGMTARVGRCRLYNAFQACEAYIGEAGAYFAPFIENCTGGSIQGGVPNTDPMRGGFSVLTEATAGIAPVGELDIVCVKTALSIGACLRGAITAIDCTPKLTDGAAFSDGCHDNDLDIYSWCHSGNLTSAVGLGGTCTRNNIRVHCQRTQNAATNNYKHTFAVSYGGVFNGDNEITIAEAYQGVKPTSGTGVSGTFEPRWFNYRYNAADVSSYYDAEANNNATIDLRGIGPVLAFTCTHNGSYTVNLDLTHVQPGHELMIGNFTNNAVAGGASVQLGNMRQSAPVVLGPGFVICRVSFDGQYWQVLEPPPAILAPATLTDAATVTPDMRVASDFAWTIGGNRTLANLANAVAGQTGSIKITQDGTGSRIITYGSNWRFPGGAAVGGVLSTAANAVDLITFQVNGDGTIDAVLSKAFAA